MLDKLNGKKTYTTIAATAALLLVAWLEGSDPKTLVSLGVLGLLGGLGTLRHAVARGAVDREAIVREIAEKLAEKASDDGEVGAPESSG